MTQEEKKLLLIDLCARLPYGVICTDLRHGDSKITDIDIEDGLVYCFDFDEYVKIENCRLYLRSMSSMTEEEGKEWEQLLNYNLSDENEMMVTVFVEDIPDYIDWFNAHHFDYRDLIEKGLALEASEGMYKTE